MSETDIVAVLEFDIDDMTGEEIALAADRLRALSGCDRRLDRHAPWQEGTARWPNFACSRVRCRRTRSRKPASRKPRRWACAAVRSADTSCDRTEVTAKLGRRDAVHVKVAQRPGGKRTAKAAHDDMVAGAGLDTRRKSSASARADARWSDNDP